MEKRTNIITAMMSSSQFKRRIHPENEVVRHHFLEAYLELERHNFTLLNVLRNLKLSSKIPTVKNTAGIFLLLYTPSKSS